jgi:subtilisin family serine protease
MSTPTFAEEGTFETTFEQGDESYPAHILLDRIAIVLSEEVLANEDLYREIVGKLGGEPIAGLSRNMIGIKVSDATDPASLRKFINDLLASHSDLISYIVDSGLLVTIAKSENPWILTDKIIVQIAEASEPDLINQIAEEHNAKIVRRNPFDQRNFVISAPADDTLQASNQINKRFGVSYALPNFYRAGVWRQAAVIPDDEFFGAQWHLNNSGQNQGTEDADIDADLAWSFGAGSPRVIIAVIDSGFDTDHPDLAGAFWTNPAEIADNNLDDDQNGFVDDVHGWDFASCPNIQPGASIDHCGDNDVSPAGLIKEPHGTAVAGAAVARAYNGPLVSAHHEGVVGVCPGCKLLPVRFSFSQPIDTQQLSIQYAQSMHADVINISWGYPRGEPAPLNVKNAINQAATAGRRGLGAVVTIAMTNESYDNCDPAYPDVPDLSSLPNVIAVAGSTNQDQVSPGGFGKCLDVVAPTDGGTLRAVTTDLRGYEGYNFALQEPNCANPEDSRAYTSCFGGLSFSAPQVAGVAGLILSLDDSLSREQVQRLLQDTSDKISDSVGEYFVEDGYSTPADGSLPKLGYGRINAFEAVRTVADPFNGRGGVDIFMRDNRLDWGNTEQPSSVTFEQTRGFIPYWQSVDIKVDAPPYRTATPESPEELSCLGIAPSALDPRSRTSMAPPATSKEFGCFAHEEPIAGTENKIYVRVHNRGIRPATNVDVKLLWATHAAASSPRLPAGFWPALASHADSGDTSTWHPLPWQTIPSVPYSGASVGGSDDDGSVVLSFDFQAPVFQQTQPNAAYMSLLAIVVSPDDPVSGIAVSSQDPGLITPRDNNISMLTIPLSNATVSNVCPVQ